MKPNTAFDRWVRSGIARQRRKPRWQKLVGNFGFGFVFLGFVANMALFVALLVSRIEPATIYHPWWLTYGLLSCITGWSWRFHGRHIRPTPIRAHSQSANGRGDS